METRPGYKLTEVGTIPEDWRVHVLGEFAKFKNGINKGSEAFGHGSPFVNLMDVFGVPDIASTEPLGLVASTSSEKSTYELRRGDVIFIRSSVKPSGVGLTAVVTEDLAGAVYSGFLIRFRDGGFIETNFKRYCFHEEGFRRRVIGASSVSANTNINQDSLKRLAIPLPPTNAEQEIIAEALRDADALIESLDQLIAKKRHLKQGAMHELLTGKTRLPGFSREWEVGCFGSLAQPGKERIDPRKTGVHPFCIELEHMEQASGRLVGSRDTGHESSLKSVFHHGDVLFGKLRAYLRKYWLADRPGVCSTEIWVLVANPSQVTPGFLYQIITTDRFIELASTAYGTHMPRSDWNVVKNYEVHLPPAAEQNAIAAILSDMDAEIAALEAKLAKARQIKQGMMQNLLTGRIRLV